MAAEEGLGWISINVILLRRKYRQLQIALPAHGQMRAVVHICIINTKVENGWILMALILTGTEKITVRRQIIRLFMVMAFLLLSDCRIRRPESLQPILILIFLFQVLSISIPMTEILLWPVPNHRLRLFKSLRQLPAHPSFLFLILLMPAAPPLPIV